MLPSPWLAARVAVSRHRPAVLSAGRVWSYGELQTRALGRAAFLAESGVGAGDRVGALLPNGSAFAELLHAVDACDATLLPLNVRLTARELAAQLAEAAPRLLLHDGGALAQTAERAAARAGVEVAALPPARESPGGVPARGRAEGAPDHPLAVIYTSGTEGRPKGACLTRANFLWSAVASAFRLGVLPDDRWLACLPLFHVGGLSILVRSVLYGTTAVVHDRFDPHAVSRALDEDGITLVSLTATMLARLLDARAQKPAPPRLRCVLLGGGPCSAPLLARARARGFPVARSYGLTEAASQVATEPASSDPAAPDLGLPPLLGTALRVVDERGRDAPAGTAGEIRVSGPTVMSGYLRRPAETADALPDGWLRTGDLGVLDAAGRVRVLDRRSDLIVSGGENVYPAEVEAALLEHAAVAEAGIAPVDDPEYGRRPVAWLALRPGAAAPSEPELRAFCRERLAGYKVPVAFRIVESLPRNASGKLLRHRLVAAVPRRPDPASG